MVNGDGSREIFLSVLAMNGDGWDRTVYWCFPKLGSLELKTFVVVMVWSQWAPVDPGESTVGYPMLFRSKGDVGAAAFIRAAVEPRVS